MSARSAERHGPRIDLSAGSQVKQNNSDCVRARRTQSSCLFVYRRVNPDIYLSSAAPAEDKLARGDRMLHFVEGAQTPLDVFERDIRIESLDRRITNIICWGLAMFR